MKYVTYQDLVSQHGEEFVLECLAEANLLTSGYSYVVFQWDEAPEDFRKLCSQGGDEDWMVLSRHVDSMVPSWIERMDSDYPVTFNLLDSVLIWVGSH